MAGYYSEELVTTAPNLSPRTKARSSDLEVGCAPFSQLPEVAPHPPVPNRDINDVLRDCDNKFVLGGGFPITKQRFYLGLVLVVILVIAASVGTAIGVLRHDQRSGPKTSSIANSTGAANATSSENLIWNHSSLAVTGWRYDSNSEYSIRLFYQDTEGYLRISALESIAGEVWTAGTRFVKAKMGTPLAASCHNQSMYDVNKTAMETHIFYLDEQSNLKEFIFEGTEDVGRPGSLNSQNITPAAGTKLASYWPSLVFQNSGNTISEVRYNCTTRPQTCWILEDLQIPRAAPSAALAEVPMGRNLEGIFLYYQRADKDLVNLAWGNETGEWKQKGFARAIPISHPAAVLATPHTLDGSALNFLVLYQDSNDLEISYVWKNGRGWNDPAKDAALAGAMKGTGIACLTPESWWDKRLEMGDELSRCFFVGLKGRLRQVQWGGQKWKDLGFVKEISGN